MVNKAIVDYIQKYHAQGYSLQTLKNFLVKQGYPINEVNEALSLAYKPEHHGKSKLFIFLMASIVLIVSISLLFLVISFMEGEEEVANISLNVYGDESNIDKGNELLYKVYIENIGTKESFPISLRYELLKDGIAEKQGSDVMNSEDGEKLYRIEPGKTGSYSLKVTGTYEGKEAYGIFNFQVISVCGDNVCDADEVCPDDCDEGPVCGDNICDVGDCEADCLIDEGPAEDYCGDGTCNTKEDFLNCPSDCEVPECGNSKCEISENYYSCPRDCEKPDQDLNSMTQYHLSIYIKEGLDSKSAESLAQECKGIEIDKNKDACFNYIAKYSESVFYCIQIENPSLKDDCYINYAYNSNDYEKCNDIGDERKKENCEALEMQYQLLQAYS